MHYAMMPYSQESMPDMHSDPAICSERQEDPVRLASVCLATSWLILSMTSKRAAATCCWSGRHMFTAVAYAFPYMIR